MTKIITLITRLEKIGIKIKLYKSHPCIYLEYVNGKRIYDPDPEYHKDIEIAYYTLKGEIKFNSLKELFKIIRKYK